MSDITATICPHRGLSVIALFMQIAISLKVKKIRPNMGGF
jgi:hypothetical protein